MNDEDKIKDYNKFRRNILKLGFYQLQFSIYVKVVPNEMGFQTVMRRIQKDIPKSGNIRVLKITEKQYESMIFLRGSSNLHELLIGDKEIVVFRKNESDKYE